MSNRDRHLLHVIAHDTPAARLERLGMLLGRPELGRQRIVQLGGGRVTLAGLNRIERVIPRFGDMGFAAHGLQSVIAAARRSVTHIWSTEALGVLLPAIARVKHEGGPDERVVWHLLADLEPPLDIGATVGAFSWLPSHARMGFVCPVDRTRRRLVKAGVPAGRCVVIRDAVDFKAIEAARRPDVRAELGLSSEQTVVLILPPVLRATGAFTAAWAAMLVAQVRPEVRLVVPGDGPEVRRVARLIKACRHTWMLRLAGRHPGPGALVAAADLAVYLPPGDAPLRGIAWAMVAGCPLVASDVGVLAEMLVNGSNAWLSRPGDPKDAACALLRAVEQWEQSRQQAEIARSHAREVFGESRLVAQYARVYENLLAGQRVDDGIRAGVPIC